jgi:hypothetical protein
MTEEEHARLRQDVERRGWPLGTFLRTVALGALAVEKPRKPRK